MSPEGQKALDEMTEAVGVQASAKVLVEGLAQFIRDNVNDNAALLAKADELDQSSTALGNALAANPLPGTSPPQPGTPAEAAAKAAAAAAAAVK